MIKRKKGFTLIELLIVIGIIGILAILGMANYRTSIERARDTERKSDLKQYQNRLAEFAVGSEGLFPVQAYPGGSICNITGALGMTDCFTDSRDPIFIYEYASIDASTGYVLWATLERCQTGAGPCYWVVCSDGRVGETVTDPDDGSTITCQAPI